MNSPMEKYIGQFPGRSGVWELLSLWSRGASLPWYMHLFTSLEASCPQPGMSGFSWRLRHVGMVGHNSIPSPSPLSGECGVWLKIPHF